MANNNIIFKKTFLVLIVIIFLFNILPFSHTFAFSTDLFAFIFLSPPKVTKEFEIPKAISPIFNSSEYDDSAGAVSAYRLELTPTNDLTFDSVFIAFPDNTSIDQTYLRGISEKALSKTGVLIDNYVVQENYFNNTVRVMVSDKNFPSNTDDKQSLNKTKLISVKSLMIGKNKDNKTYVKVVFTPVKVSHGNKLVIFLDKRLGIVNPLINRPCYQAAVSTYLGKTPVVYTTTGEYGLNVSSIYNISTKVTPGLAGTYSKGDILFFNGILGNIVPGVDCVNMMFSSGVSPRNPDFDVYISPTKSNLTIVDPKVQASNSSMPVSVSNGSLSITNTTILEAPNLVYPMSGCSVDTVSPVFQWTSFPGAESYEIYITDNRGRLVYDRIISNNVFSLSNTTLLRNDNSYKWRVRAFVNGEPLEWSNFSEFTVNTNLHVVDGSLDGNKSLIYINRNSDSKIPLKFSFQNNAPNDIKVQLKVLDIPEGMKAKITPSEVTPYLYGNDGVYLEVSVGNNATFGRHTIFVEYSYKLDSDMVKKVYSIPVYVSVPKDKVVISLPNGISANRGNIIYLPIYTYNLSHLSQLNFSLKYNPYVLTFLDIYPSATLLQLHSNIKAEENVSGEVALSVNAANIDIPADRILAYAEFYVGVRPRISDNTNGMPVIMPLNIPEDLSGWTKVSMGTVYKDGNKISVYFPIYISALSGVLFKFKDNSLFFNGYSNNVLPKYYVALSSTIESQYVYHYFKVSPPSIVSPVLDLSSHVAGTFTNLDLSFNTSSIGNIGIGNSIFLKFPAQFFFGEKIFHVLVNNVKANATVQFSDNNWTVEIKSPIKISANSKVKILFPEETLLKTPLSEGNYNVNIWTTKDDYPMTLPIKITHSTIANLQFSMLHSGAGLTNAFNISFNVGSNGYLKAGIDKIFIRFNKAFSLPQSCGVNSVKVQGEPVKTVVVKDVYNGLDITVPVDVYNNDIVRLNIGTDCGIENPKVPALYKYVAEISTTKEPYYVRSEPVTITPLPVVEFTLSPQKPDGENGYYLETPIVLLSTSNGEKVYYKMDNEKFTLYKSPISVPNGIHTIYAYAVDSAGNEGIVQEKVIKVDTTPPVVAFDQGNNDLYVNTTNPTLTGRVSEVCSELRINGVNAKINDDLTFSVSITVSDGGAITVYAKDIAGKTVSLVRKVYIDNSPPVITLISPSTNKVEINENSFDVKLQTNEKCIVTINGKVVNNDNTGYVFEKKIDLVDGKNLIEVTATDRAGNESTEQIIIDKVNQTVVVLQIGSRNATIDGKSVLLDTEPILRDNTTLVPLRFISDVFGAEIQWNNALKVITLHYKSYMIQLQIDSKIVTVNRKIKKLNTAPIIKDNRTLVPIRFISETFGAKIKWADATKTITLIYTPTP